MSNPSSHFDAAERTPPDLFSAVLINSVALCRARIATGGDVHAVDALGRTPLHLAGKAATASVGHVLLNSGANVHAIDHAYRTPLHFAVTSDDPEALEFTQLLLSRGADIAFVPDGDPKVLEVYRTPFEHALSNGQPNVAAYLLKRYSHLVDAITLGGQTMAHIASEENRPLVLAVQTERAIKAAAGGDDVQRQTCSSPKSFGPL